MEADLAVQIIGLVCSVAVTTLTVILYLQRVIQTTFEKLNDKIQENGKSIARIEGYLQINKPSINTNPE